MKLESFVKSEAAVSEYRDIKKKIEYLKARKEDDYVMVGVERHQYTGNLLDKTVFPRKEVIAMFEGRLAVLTKILSDAGIEV